MIKGTWYYEIQILMFVIMWKHDMKHIAQDPTGVTWGRLHIWWDTAWLDHGVPGKIADFFSSMIAYLKLYKAGFSISNTNFSDKMDNFEINRFYWRGKVIREMPDIDRVGDHYNTINNGHVEKL